KSCTQLRSPFVLVAIVKGPRIGRGQGITANPVVIFTHQRRAGLEPQIRPDKDPPQSVRILSVKRLAVIALVARLEADEVRGRLVTRAVIAEYFRHQRYFQLGCRPNIALSVHGHQTLESFQYATTKGSRQTFFQLHPVNNIAPGLFLSKDCTNDVKL